MTTFLISFVVVALAVAAMATGVLFGRSPLRGSCGGLAGRGCLQCERPCARRDASKEDR